VNLLVKRILTHYNVYRISPVAPILSLINPVDVTSACSFILHALLRFQIGLVCSGFPPKILYASLFTSVRVTYFLLIILTLTGE